MFTKNGWSEKIVRFLFAVSPKKSIARLRAGRRTSVFYGYGIELFLIRSCFGRRLEWRQGEHRLGLGGIRDGGAAGAAVRSRRVGLLARTARTLGFGRGFGCGVVCGGSRCGIGCSGVQLYSGGRLSGGYICSRCISDGRY